MDAHAQSAILAAIVTLALAVAVLLRPQRTRLFTLFAALNFALCVWELSDFLWSITASTGWMRLALGCAALLPAAVQSFTLEFLGETSPRALRTLRALEIFAGLALVYVATPAALVGWTRSILAAAVFLGFVPALWLLYTRMRRTASRPQRARLLYLVVGATAVVLFGVTDTLTRLGIPLPPLGNVAVTAYMYFLAQTLQLHRLLDINELLGKFVVVSLLAVTLAAFFGLISYWVSDRPGLFLFNTIVASFVILILFDPLKSKVEATVVRLLFREKFEFLRTLSALKQRMPSVIDVRELGSLMLDTLYDTGRVTHVSFYILSDDGMGYRLLDHRGPMPSVHLDLLSVRALVAAAQQGQKAVLQENVERRLSEVRTTMIAEGTGGPAHEEEARLSEMGAAMGAMCAGICIPLVGGERVIGFLNLMDDRVTEAFASDEIAPLLEVGDQAAINVENSRLYERMKERDRLAALGEMAAGLAHEIRNPLGAIKGAAQYLNPDGAPEDEFLQVIVEEVNRLNAVVTEFLEYSRPLKASFAPLDVNDVLERTVKLMTPGLPAGIAVQLDLAPDVPRVEGDADQLKQVFINLIQNAAQAMPQGGTIHVAARRPRVGDWREKDTDPQYLGDLCEIRFRDQGKGIPEEMRERIFIPFYTTKEKGTGLGLAICQRIVKIHNGSIEVKSRLGEGTEFVIRLPAAAPPAARASAAVGAEDRETG